ncbi:MAG: YlmC/YmxH family sporulation protein [Firmicutes bacterium]|nr:YlmC/YmxH family sporulation protein [Bacillota bacterium]
MRASELQAKDVVNVADGRKLGVIGDLDIDLDSGLVRSMIIPPSGKFFGMIANGEEVVIPWSQIVKIGSDVVLVDIRAGESDNAYLNTSRSSLTSGGY